MSLSPSSRPVVVSGVAFVGTEFEGVVVDETRDELHLLNAHATLVWQCIDGDASIGEIVDDLAAELTVGRAALMADTVAVLQQFADLGLITVDTPPTAEPSRSDPADAPFDAAGELRIEVAGRTASVVSNDPKVLTALRRLLGDLPASSAKPELRLGLLSGRVRGAIAPLHYLYRGDDEVLRCSTHGRLFRAALAWLEELTDAPDTVRLGTRTFVCQRGAVLVAASQAALLDLPERRLAAGGWRSIDGPSAEIAERHVVVRACQLVGDRDIVREIGAGEEVELIEARPASAHIPVIGLVMVGFAPQSLGLDSPARRLQRISALALRDGSIRARDLAALWDLAQRVDTYTLAGYEYFEVPELLERLARGSLSARADAAALTDG